MSHSPQTNPAASGNGAMAVQLHRSLSTGERAPALGNNRPAAQLIMVRVSPKLRAVNVAMRALCSLALCSLAISLDTLAASESKTNKFEFNVFWPPRDPTETAPPGGRPLLAGRLVLRMQEATGSIPVAHVRVLLSRPSDPVGREFWNSQLAFPEYDWMRYVRVWDTGNQWLWPNLAYLLRLHGIERVERYGGVDPGKGVDNDFAAVLIRKYDPSGTIEDELTKKSPLVSAEWHPVGSSAPVNKQTIVHSVESDEFTMHLGQVEKQQAQGSIAVWLIYADFMGARVPPKWPGGLEFAGGILAYFEVQWALSATGPQIKIVQLVPKRATGFDWERWVALTRAARNLRTTTRLSDLGTVTNATANAVAPRVSQGTNAATARP